MDYSKQAMPPDAVNGNVYPLSIKPRPRGVPQLSDAEILKLRQLIANAGGIEQLLEKAETVLTACPVAQRILSTR